MGTSPLSHWSCSFSLPAVPLRDCTAVIVSPVLGSDFPYYGDELCLPINHRAGSPVLAAYKRHSMLSSDICSLHRAALKAAVCSLAADSATWIASQCLLSLPTAWVACLLSSACGWIYQCAPCTYRLPFESSRLWLVDCMYIIKLNGSDDVHYRKLRATY